jgi:hypothetical protein
MAIQYSTAIRNGRLDQVESVTGTSPKLQIRSGTKPANCASANSGTLLATLTLPSDWLAAASSGQKAKSGTWSGTCSTGGTAGHFRIFDSSETTCHMQGTCGQGTGDLSFDNATFTLGQVITINTFTLTEGNA